MQKKLIPKILVAVYKLKKINTSINEEGDQSQSNIGSQW